MEMLVSFLGSVIFTGAISIGPGRRLVDHPAGRPVLGAIGFLIVLAGYSYSKRDMGMFMELVAWFILCCFPVLMGGVLTAIAQSDHDRQSNEANLLQNLLQYFKPTAGDN